jgi:hypothetical protein
LLVRPSSIVDVREPDRRRMEDLSRELGETGTPAVAGHTSSRDFESGTRVEVRTLHPTEDWLHG